MIPCGLLRRERSVCRKKFVTFSRAAAEYASEALWGHRG